MENLRHALEGRQYIGRIGHVWFHKSAIHLESQRQILTASRRKSALESFWVVSLSRGVELLITFSGIFRHKVLAKDILIATEHDLILPEYEGRMWNFRLLALSMLLCSILTGESSQICLVKLPEAEPLEYSWPSAPDFREHCSENPGRCYCFRGERGEH